MTAPAADKLFAHIRAFEWDERKRESNLRNHEIDFQDARRVIDGATFIRQSDRKGEIHYMVYGLLDQEEVVIICTFRGDSCRIISARRARRDERKRYHHRLPR
jgi:uncharacterized DUF497 family protein